MKRKFLFNTHTNLCNSYLMCIVSCIRENMLIFSCYNKYTSYSTPARSYQVVPL